MIDEYEVGKQIGALSAAFDAFTVEFRQSQDLHRGEHALLRGEVDQVRKRVEAIVPVDLYVAQKARWLVGITIAAVASWFALRFNRIYEFLR